MKSLGYIKKELNIREILLKLFREFKEMLKMQI